jgi:hypothetical protein
VNRILCALFLWTLIVAPLQVTRGQTTGFPATVSGSIDCNSGSFCYIKDLRIEGEIVAYTADRLGKLVEELKRNAERAKKQVHPFSVELKSPGGSVAAALTIGRTLRRESIGATIAFAFPPREPGICASACVLIFAGAIRAGRGNLHRTISGVSA